MKETSKKMSRRDIIIFIAVLAAAAALMFLVWKLLSPSAQTWQGDKTIIVNITHSDGSTVNIEHSTDTEYLWDAMAERGLIDGTDSEFGKWVTTVDGEVADEANGQYWLFTRGEEWVTTSCDTTPIADGETYEFFIYGYDG